MSRYLERADHVARQLDVHLTIVPEQATDAARRRRGRLIESLVSEAYGGTANSDYELAALLTFDEDNPNSILTCVQLARENARQVREQINSQMWEQLNQIYLEVTEASLDQLWRGQPHAFYHRINQEVYQLQGITDSRMCRDQGWHFVQLGRYLERAVAMAQVLDAEYRDRYSTGLRAGTGDTGSYLEWIGLLRACAAYEAFSKVYPTELDPRNIAEFLLLDNTFPYSVHFAMDAMLLSLEVIGEMTETSKAARVYRLAGRLHALADYAQIDEIMASGLGSALLDIRHKCAEIHDAIYQTYITYPVDEKLAA
jgi:uncharacterized alpha-E superfamily protein